MSDSLRIAYVLPGFCSDDNDPCIPVITAFVREMSRHAETVIYTAGYPHRTGSYSVHGVPVHCTGALDAGRLERLNAWRRLGRLLEADHRGYPFDLVHGFWGTGPGYVAARVARKIDLPSVVSLAGGEFADNPEEEYGSQRFRRLRWLIGRSLLSATAITAGSEWLAGKVPERLRDRLSTIPLGIDSHAFSPGNLRIGRRLLAVSAMIPIKDYPTMLHGTALARRSVPDLSLTLAGWNGNPQELRRVQRLIDELELADAVSITGEHHYRNMPALYRSHDLLLHSSRYEAQGMAIIEAIATGMPAISTNVGIVPSLPENMVHRYEPGDWNELGRLIVSSLSDGRHAAQALEAGPELVRRQFDVGIVAGRFFELYRRMNS